VRADAARAFIFIFRAPPRGDRGSSLIVDVDGVFSERRCFATRARVTLTNGRPESAPWGAFRKKYLTGFFRL